MFLLIGVLVFAAIVLIFFWIVLMSICYRMRGPFLIKAVLAIMFFILINAVLVLLGSGFMHIILIAIVFFIVGIFMLISILSACKNLNKEQENNDISERNCK